MTATVEWKRYPEEANMPKTWMRNTMSGWVEEALPDGYVEVRLPDGFHAMTPVYDYAVGDHEFWVERAERMRDAFLEKGVSDDGA